MVGILLIFLFLGLYLVITAIVLDDTVAKVFFGIFGVILLVFAGMAIENLVSAKGETPGVLTPDIRIEYTKESVDTIYIYNRPTHGE